MGFVNKIVDWIKGPRLISGQEVVANKSRFEGFLRHGEKEGKHGVVSAVTLCDEALDIVAERVMLINRLKSLEERMAEVECYGRLTDKEADALKGLLDRYTALTKELATLKSQAAGFDKDLPRMEHLEKEARQDLPEIKFAEEHRQIFKYDIDCLEGEKATLVQERSRLNKAVSFVHKFSAVLVLFFCGVVLAAVFLHVFRDMQIVTVLSVMLAAAILLSAMIYALRRRLKHELLLNFKKQERAVELLNKKIAVYAHFTNYLNYEYKKFHVVDGETLINNLVDYNNYKQIVKRLSNLHNIMSQTEEDIGLFLKNKGIDTKFSPIAKFAATLNLDDKKQFYEELLREKGMIEKSLEGLDTRNSQIWDTLMSLLNSREHDFDIINKIIENYEEKAEHLLNMDKAEGTTAMDAAMGADI